jgi:Ca-activated chloride channel family protein
VRKATQKGVLLAIALMALAPGAAAQTSDLVKPRSSVLIVLDSSQAMGRERLAVAKRAVVRAVRALPEGTPVGLRVYGGKASAKDHAAACSDSRALLPVAPADADAMQSELKDLKPAGLSPVSLAILRGAKDLPPTGSPTIVLVGSGADDCAPPPECQTITGARQPVRVDAIGFQTDAAGRRGLQCAARRNGGIYSDAASADALEPELEAALGRATRDRRSLGKPLAGGIAESQATFAKPGTYVDSIAPDTERWYTVPVPGGRALSIAATIVAPPTGDMSAPGSSLGLSATSASSNGSTIAGATTNAPTVSNLFAFDPSRSVTASMTAPKADTPNSVRVVLHDSPDKQLAQKLHGRSLALELLFGPPPPTTQTPATPGPIVGGMSFNDAATVGSGTFSDALDTGGAVFYGVHLDTGQTLSARAAVDVGGLDPSVTGTSGLIVRLYGPLRGKDAEAQQLGPGDPATHLKTTSAQLGPVKQAGDYYVSAGMNDFLPDSPKPVQLPLSLTVSTASSAPKPPPARQTSDGGTSWVVFAAIAAAVLVAIGAGGLVLRRR